MGSTYPLVTPEALVQVVLSVGKLRQVGIELLQSIKPLLGLYTQIKYNCGLLEIIKRLLRFTLVVILNICLYAQYMESIKQG